MKPYFKILLITIAMTSLLCFSCSDATSPLNFGQMNVVYTKSGGWINQFKIEVKDEGLTLFYELGGPVDTLIADTTYLNDKDKSKLSTLFGSFESFKREYQPAPYRTDQNYHVIVLNYEDKQDTVSVYDPERCALPGDLKKIIDFFESKIDFFNEKNS